MVHNGIIETFRELREELTAKGYRIGTEEVAHSVTEEMQLGRAPCEAVVAALPRLRGAFAPGFLFAGEGERLIGARQSAPLAVGLAFGQASGAGSPSLKSSRIRSAAHKMRLHSFAPHGKRSALKNNFLLF